MFLEILGDIIVLLISLVALLQLAYLSLRAMARILTAGRVRTPLMDIIGERVMREPESTKYLALYLALYYLEPFIYIIGMLLIIQIGTALVG